MRGEIRVEGDSGRAEASFQAVNLDGNVEGLLSGRAGKPKAGLLANFSATFGAGGFTDGKLGSGASANEAVLFSRGCVSDAKKPNEGAPTRDAKPKGDAKPKDDTQQQTTRQVRGK